jgi:NAD(P)-dependent dehydrogenase (short-subunit alcohol dehydrogenase family)
VTHKKLVGQVAIVTGAAGGIGGATARRFVAEGACVVLADVDKDRLMPLVEELDGSAVAARCDVGRSEDLEAAVDQALEAFGRLDVMVNNAAIGAAGPIAELREEDWTRMLNVNVGGVINGTRCAAAALRGHGGGSIVNVSSLATHRAMTGLGQRTTRHRPMPSEKSTAPWEWAQLGNRERLQPRRWC